MSTLWTPSGERPIRRNPDPASPTRPSASDAFNVVPDAFGGVAPENFGPEPQGVAGYPEGITPEMAEQIMAMQEQMLKTPAAVIIVNQCLSFYELAALHLDQEVPNLSEAQIAIDAFAAVVEGLGSRLGPNERPLREALAQIRLAFVQLKSPAPS